MLLDKDLQSIQEVRTLLNKAKEAQAHYALFSQEEVDSICKAMAEAGREAAPRLAEMAVKETGFGVVRDKTIKNIVATEMVFNYIQSMRTVGVINRDQQNRVFEIAEPVGIVAGIIPSTNPTSTTLYKILISLKARNGIVLSPHPSALRCTQAAMKVMEDAALAAGAPSGLIGCLSFPSREGTQELMSYPHTAVILATGGTAMVKAAYSSGKPAYGVGPGNVPVFIERTADLKKAVSDILISKTFDNGTVCASEQAIVTDSPIHERVVAELKNSGAYFMVPEQEIALGKILVSPQGTINPKLVGQSALYLAEKSGFSVPDNTRVLIAQPQGVGPQYPLSREKLSPVLALYKEKDWKTACERCIEVINFGGIGHTMGIHSQDDEIIMEFALKKPVFRIIANSPTTHGAVGFSTGLPPALTLGCGTWGGSSTSDNVTPLHLINWKRLAYGIREVLPDKTTLPVMETTTVPALSRTQRNTQKQKTDIIKKECIHPLNEEDIRKIVSRFLAQKKL
ncbi:acetaldehyde dehydrogenase (acetylating) [candidate division CSSED10-310 bacterium]|uniref:Acetaldehyde dehydrogenase (Acetylating) n=1 Tax=candidate division CSSED10-310 bacterium TaxID=2855610 RepID=A0ABV6YRF1_UNCC1